MTDGQMEEIKRYFGVIAGGLPGEIRQVAEGHDVLRQEIPNPAPSGVISLIRASYTDLDAKHADLARWVERGAER